MSEHRPTRAEIELEAHAELALQRAVLAEMAAPGVAEEVLEQQRENVAFAAGTAELLRHSEPGHDCAGLGCRVDDLITRLCAALTGVPLGWSAPAGDPGAGGATIRVSLLGGFGVTRDGVACELPTPEQRLVALVALHRRVGLAWAAKRLAPRVAPADAVARLQEALAGLRAAGLDIVDSDGRLLSLAAGVTVDTEEAEAFFSRLARQGGDPRWSADHDRLLLELLPDWTDYWVFLARSRFEDLSLNALDTEIRRMLDGGAPGSSVTFAQKVLRADPLRESTLHLLLEGHLAQGRDDLARDAYLAFGQALLDELGLEPSPAAHSLVAHLLGEEGRARSAPHRRTPARQRHAGDPSPGELG